MPDPAKDEALAEAVSEAVSRLFLDTFGRGPIDIETTVRGDMIVSLMRDVFTVAEKSMIAAGKGDQVLNTRMQWQAATDQNFKDEIGRVVGREVLAVISGVELGKEMASELFVLAPEDGGPGSA